MVAKSLVWALAVATFANGFAISERAFPPYVAPGPNDARSPCPGLNSLANHGFIPHSGKGMTVPILIKGLSDGMNVGADFSTAIGGAGLLSNPDALAGYFDLDDLDEHDFPIEHDGSLSRQDAYFGNDHSFNQTIFNQVLKYYKGMTNATIPVASLARYHRIQESRAIDPNFVYGAREFVLSYGETALYLSTMGDPITGVAPLKYIKVLFEQERLPYKEGWRKPATQTTLLTLGAMVQQLYAANPEALPEGLSLGPGTLKYAFEARDPVTGKLANLTCALLGEC